MAVPFFLRPQGPDEPPVDGALRDRKKPLIPAPGQYADRHGEVGRLLHLNLEGGMSFFLAVPTCSSKLLSSIERFSQIPPLTFSILFKGMKPEPRFARG